MTIQSEHVTRVSVLLDLIRHIYWLNDQSRERRKINLICYLQTGRFLQRNLLRYFPTWASQYMTYNLYSFLDIQSDLWLKFRSYYISSDRFTAWMTKANSDVKQICMLHAYTGLLLQRNLLRHFPTWGDQYVTTYNPEKGLADRNRKNSKTKSTVKYFKFNNIKC